MLRQCYTRSAAGEKTVTRFVEDYRAFVLAHDERRSSEYLEALAITLSRRHSHFYLEKFQYRQQRPGTGQLEGFPNRASQPKASNLLCYHRIGGSLGRHGNGAPRI
ncbi:hypothetical protein ASPBRDRAFT_506056 [Aspergillus brasiliensis CBS 101740]|uniref:Uncharacterized protein n=1 Tax=Aspergillus brasiliensis (strain CBS 101740 / IMI 381727 / IBT 21946) TaxID=767769 RepID=A0A1L9UPF3_ASPBC|nr:hypothetical protein ASPBRDRAFT_506056 [Aspergillus brasiliensis CBS 101740]